MRRFTFCDLVNISSSQSSCKILTQSSNPLDNSKCNRAINVCFPVKRFIVPYLLQTHEGQVWFSRRLVFRLWLYGSIKPVVYLEMRWRGISTTDSSAEGCDTNMTPDFTFACQLLKNFHHAQVNRTDLDLAWTEATALNPALTIFMRGGEGGCVRFLFINRPRCVLF